MNVTNGRTEIISAADPGSEMSKPTKLAVENVNHPGKIRYVDPAKYDPVKAAILKVLPDAPPGMTIAQLQVAIVPCLPDEQFPGGARAGWWTKTVQLDLEAKKIIAREHVSPLRLHRLQSR